MVAINLGELSLSFCQEFTITPLHIPLHQSSLNREQNRIRIGKKYVFQTIPKEQKMKNK